jgi:uncharacterized membrane protein YeaQ/YmgE (transglycosylase-associated protein family)
MCPILAESAFGHGPVRTEAFQELMRSHLRESGPWLWASASECGYGYQAAACRGRSAELGGHVEIIGVIIAGIIIGLLGKFVAPSTRDNIPIWLTILCGIAGVIIGWYIYTAFGGNGSPGIDWVRWLIAIAVAAVFVIIADAVMVRMRASRTTPQV